MIHVFGADSAAGTVLKLELGGVADWVGQRRGPVWIDLEGEDVKRLPELGGTFHLHPLALEDALGEDMCSHPRVDDFGENLFIVLHSARWDEGEPAPTLREINIFLGQDYLITSHVEPMRAVTGCRELCDRRPDLLLHGPSFVLHRLADIMVDNFYPVIERIDEQIDDVEEQVFKSNDKAVLNHIFALKRGLLSFRRIVGPERDTLLALTRDEFGMIVPAVRPYMRDVYDRLARVSDLLESYRDEIATLLEIYLSIVSNRLNEVMKTLTVFATVLMPLTLITGIYGMNIKLREYDVPHAELYFWGLMIVVGVAAWIYIKRRRWL